MTIYLMEFIGIRGAALDWMMSYLQDREQYEVYNNTLSCNLEISCRVSQESILRPLLFLNYVINLANVSEILFPILFSDDTYVFVNGKDINAFYG